MTVTEWKPLEEDEHGDFKYTLRQYLLMRRLQQGGEWPEVVAAVDKQFSRNHEWDVDPESTDTYRNWTTWYNANLRDKQTT